MEELKIQLVICRRTAAPIQFKQGRIHSNSRKIWKKRTKSAKKNWNGFLSINLRINTNERSRRAHALSRFTYRLFDAARSCWQLFHFVFQIHCLFHAVRYEKRASGPQDWWINWRNWTALPHKHRTFIGPNEEWKKHLEITKVNKQLRTKQRAERFSLVKNIVM